MDFTNVERYLQVGTPGLFARHASMRPRLDAEGYPAHDADGEPLYTPDWKLVPHLKILDKALVMAATGRLRFLIIEMPPRHGKSELTSKYFPGYFLGTFPDKELLLCSYGMDLAKGLGRKARNLIERWGPELWGIHVSGASRAAHQWQIDDHNGAMYCAGARGPITGKGAHIGIIDDPVKNEQQALSSAFREELQEWYKATFLTRIYDGGCVIIIQTRWHEDDLAGWVWRQVKDKPGAMKITLPALAYYPEDLPPGEWEPDPLGRAPGEALCPELRSLESLLELRSLMGEFWFSALFQQRPVPASGGTYQQDWFKFWDPGDLLVVCNDGVWTYGDASRRYDDLIQSWDCSFKDTKASSYVVGQVWARKGANRLLLDQVRDRMSLPATIEAAREFSRRWPITKIKLFEGKANGPDVVKVLKAEISGMKLFHPLGTKIERAAAHTWLAASGNIWLPPKDRYPWVSHWLAEVCGFPKAAHSDQLDGYTQAQSHWARTSGGVRMVACGNGTDWAGMRK